MLELVVGDLRHDWSDRDIARHTRSIERLHCREALSRLRSARFERSNPTSRELLRVRIERGCSIVTVVRRFGTASSASTWSSHSPSAARSFRLKRVGVELRVAPRPSLDSTGIQSFYAVSENITRTLFRKHLVRLRRTDSVGW